MLRKLLLTSTPRRALSSGFLCRSRSRVPPPSPSPHPWLSRVSPLFFSTSGVPQGTSIEQAEDEIKDAAYSTVSIDRSGLYNPPGTVILSV